MGFFRFVLAINVVLFHILKVPHIGPFAVYSFFILSGFLMTTIVKDTYGYHIAGFKAYAVNRFLRLYPIHWFLLAFSVLVITTVGQDFAFEYNKRFGMPVEVSAWLANLTLIFPSFLPIEVAPRLSPATWALTIELFFYLLIGLGISKSKTSTLVWLLLSAVYWLYRIILYSDFTSGYGNLLTASLPFSLGATLYYYKDTLWCLLSKLSAQPTKWLTLLFTLNLVTCVLVNSWKVGVVGTYINLLLTSILVVAIYIEKAHFIGKQSDKFFGDLSYPIYLCHWSACCLVAWFFNDQIIVDAFYTNLVIFFSGLILAFVIAIMANKLVNDKVESVRYRVKKRLTTSKLPSQ